MNRFHPARAAPSCLLAVVAALACAPKQRIALDCIPKEVTVYVDGEALEKTPSEISLRSDQPHTLFVKGPGYQPEMIVLTSEEGPDGHQLSPAEVCVRPRYVGVRRELQVEIENPVETPEPIPAAN